MVYNNFGESFYVKGADLGFTSLVIGVLWPWIMPLLFLVSGIGSYHSLQKRTVKEYLTERIHRLFIPLFFGILFLVPIQTFLAEKFHNAYQGNYFEQYILFFTKPTDLSGYHGGFTPAHLWFLLYLFIISLVSLPIIHLCNKSRKRLDISKITLPILLTFFIIPVLSQVILDIEGKSLGEYLAWYLLGYFIMSKDEIQDILEKHRIVLAIASALMMIIYALGMIFLESYNVILYEIFYGLYAYTTVLAILGMGKKRLNFTNRVTSYMTKSSFGIYLFHQEWVVISAYFVILNVTNIPLQIISILIFSIIFTFFTQITFRKIPFLRYIFGLTK